MTSPKINNKTCGSVDEFITQKLLTRPYHRCVFKLYKIIEFSINFEPKRSKIDLIRLTYNLKVDEMN